MAHTMYGIEVSIIIHAAIHGDSIESVGNVWYLSLLIPWAVDAHYTQEPPGAPLREMWSYSLHSGAPFVKYSVLWTPPL